MDSLPKDMAARIASLVAEQAAEPMRELRSLRSASSSMRSVCSRQEVGRSINLDRALQERGWDDLPYNAREARQLTRNLAAVGNPWACFYEGMRIVFIERWGDANPDRRLFEVAASRGHQVARYVLAMLIYKDNTGSNDDLKAKQLLRQVEGEDDDDKDVWTNQSCTMMLQQAHQALEPMRGEAPVDRWTGLLTLATSRPPAAACTSAGCGSDYGWQGWHRTSTFCSQDCRIEHERKRFCKLWWV